MPPVTLRRLLLLALAVASLALPATAQAAAPQRSLVVGAAETAAEVPDPVLASLKMALAKNAGFSAIRLSATWSPGQTAPADADLTALQNAALAADLAGIAAVVSIDHGGSSRTPLTADARAQYAQVAAALAKALPTVHSFIIGNEPNLNRFWMPQFGPRGRDLAAPAYEALLAQAYDALKAVSPAIEVIGGAVSPHGSDNPRAPRQTHSPTVFILDLGAAYRRSGRTRPIMDAFALHPYGASSSVSPAVVHPRSTTITIADYPKLVKLLDRAFRRTAQPGARLPIVYAEYGIQTQIPADKLGVYTNVGVPTAGDAVDESVQGVYYRQAIKLAYCQATVKALFFFHVSDEADLDRWQSGVYYADDTPKSDLGAVRYTANAAQAGLLGRCPKQKPKPKAKPGRPKRRR